MAIFWVKIGIGIEADTPQEAAVAAWEEIREHYMDITDENTGEFEQYLVGDVIDKSNHPEDLNRRDL